ncbi:MAG: DUF4381 domain-containing protein [Pseudomonadales bacterium]|nr:DUF4381 domain-containing protein [Pseudomonadales bacterium]MBO6563945.1 DUF4381 domain-containing protein [Pseudomonadales bacterium]MBO6595950.1 DUF4381 domain-containing protein [Pseudomonadales bacterium]MBO6656816.1 DUF4381 domain-containing protein [Pseudomonadales bacterium]MBO6702555.1 DUF4381 domain-containing protein [Pseudomonadales bacterium]
MASAATPPNPGMMQQATDPLAQLRDIHPPGMIETWPPAPGWWVLAAISLALLLYGLYWLIQRWIANRYRREAMSELHQLRADWHDHGDDQVYLEALQRLLKRVALTRFSRDDVAGLTGEAWVQFLDRSTGSHDFSMADSEALIDGAYREDVSIDVQSLEITAKNWIEKHDKRHLEEALEETSV